MIPFANYILREITRNSRQQVHKLLVEADEDFKAYLGLTGSILDNVEDLCSNICNDVSWLIYVDGVLAGIVYIYDYDTVHNKCALGYGLLPKFRGKNISTPLISSVCDYIEKTFDMIRIQADIEERNERCLSWFKRNSITMGFAYERMSYNYWGKGVNCHIFARCV